MRRILLAVGLVFLSAACAPAPGSGSEPGVSSGAPGDAAAGEYEPVDPEMEGLGPHGLVPAEIGVPVEHPNFEGVTDGTVTVTGIRRVGSAECTNDPLVVGEPAAGRFFLAVDVRVELAPSYSPTESGFPGTWGVIAADDSVDPAPLQTYEAYSCLTPGETLPSTFTAGTSVVGAVVLETAAESGWVTLTPLTQAAAGWEWRYDVGA
jgi:hypothetical protein